MLKGVGQMNWYIYEDPDAGPVYINIDLITLIAAGDYDNDTLVYSGSKFVRIFDKPPEQVIAEINVILTGTK